MNHPHCRLAMEDSVSEKVSDHPHRAGFAGSQQLAEQGAGRHEDRFVAGKGIGWDKFPVHDKLESVRCLKLSLEMAQRGTDAPGSVFHFDKKPGILVSNDDEIHLALLFVAETSGPSMMSLRCAGLSQFR